MCGKVEGEILGNEPTFKLRPDLYSRWLNKVLESANKYKDTQQLREQLSQVLQMVVTPDHKY